MTVMTSNQQVTRSSTTTTATTTAASHDDDKVVVTDIDCPICLEVMTDADHRHPIQCQSKHFVISF